MWIRVQVEPCDLELSEGKILPLSSLQSAFPGCTGLSYRTEDGVKRCLQFDGRNFHAPSDGWDAIKNYTVHLGGKQSFPFDSYENASKQFERCVNTVQKMMSMQEVDYTPPSPPSPSQNPRERLLAFRKKVANYRGSAETLAFDYPNSVTSSSNQDLERQFADLSAIVAGKDTIIDNLRKRLTTEEEARKEAETKVKALKQELVEWRARSEALDSELQLFRQMGSQQESMTSKVKQLNNDLEELKNTSNTKLHSLQCEYERVCGQLNELQSQHDLLVAMHSKTCHTLDDTKKQYEETNDLLEQLKRRFGASEKDYLDQLRSTNEAKDRLYNEYNQVLQRLKENERAYQENVMRLQENGKRSQSETEAALIEMKEKYMALSEEYDEKIHETASLNTLVDNLNRHLTDITVKYKDLRTANDESPRNRYIM